MNKLWNEKYNEGYHYVSILNVQILGNFYNLKWTNKKTMKRSMDG